MEFNPTTHANTGAVLYQLSYVGELNLDISIKLEM